jgi:membrane protease YdiL (CAAX protease family)
MKKRQHKILDHAIVGYFLLILFVSIAESLGSFVDRLIGNIYPAYVIETVVNGKTVDIANGVGIALAALLALLIFKLWFKPDYDGCLPKYGFKEGILMLLPFLVIHWAGSVVSWITLGTGPVFLALLRATAPGFGEEVMFRGLGVANYMRTIKSESQIKVIFWLSSIAFGLMHLSNIAAGGDVTAVIIQSIYAMGVGMILGAVYLRTGNLWPAILGHMSLDFMEFIRVDLSGNGGIMTGMGIGDWITIAAAVFAAFMALRLMKPEHNAQIMELWAKKWNKTISQ